MNYCTNCGNKLYPGDKVCTNCGELIMRNETPKVEKDPRGKSLAVVSIVFGSLGFGPLPFVGSLVGFITGLIGILKYNYQKQSKIGFWLSIGSFLFWTLFVILVTTI